MYVKYRPLLITFLLIYLVVLIVINTFANTYKLNIFISEEPTERQTGNYIMMKCDLRTCKARCCYNVPFSKRFFNAFRKRVATPVKWMDEWGDMDGDIIVLPHTADKAEDNKCPFLNERCRCNIYDMRPKICRIYGHYPVTHEYLRCGYLEGRDMQSIQSDKSLDENLSMLVMNMRQMEGLYK